MKETPLSNCEREFILKAIGDRKRLDCRERYQYRPTTITFGRNQGCCQVSLGNTRVLAQISCDVTAPKQTRPSEGILFVNVEISPMAAPHFDSGRLSEECVELTRLLERCLKESRCVDTESLCIVAGIKVWQIRCDVHVLNHDGNLMDCASIAAIAALAHFRRPDVTIIGEEVTIHSLEDKDPIPLSVHHMPVCVTFAFYNKGKCLLMDPTEREEHVMEGKLVIGMNKHQEVCALQMTGSMLLHKQQVLECSTIAVKKVQEITNFIQEALQKDMKDRVNGKECGFGASVQVSNISSYETQMASVSTHKMAEAQNIVHSSSSSSESYTSDENIDTPIHILGKGTGMIGEGGPSTWDIDTKEDWDMIEELKVEQTQQQKQTQKISHVINLAQNLSSDSEEEETITLAKEDLNIPRESESSASMPTINLSKALKVQKRKKLKD